MITDSPSIAIPLIQLNAAFKYISDFLKLASWHKSKNSFLALILIWFICLISRPLVLPFIILSVLAYPRHTKPTGHTLQTEHSVESVVSDITTIQSLLPALPPPLSLTYTQLLRVLAFAYIPYFFITLFVSFRVVLAITLTALFTWRAPWAIVLRAAIWRSAWVRWCAYSLWARMSGVPLPPKSVYTAATKAADNQDEEAEHSAPVQSLRFLFTVYENQRWWMGLDWTAALLPGERPSWCSASQLPMSPPNAFSLPADTVVYLPDPKGTGKIKRTATWRWEEPEWKVLVHKDHGALNRVDKPLPVLEKEESSPTTSRFIKAAGRLRESSLGSFDKTPSHAEEHSVEDPNIIIDDPLTDGDGWVYGDNKWEAQSHKGGMGKYTRFRRWTRIAVVFETVERVAADDGDKSTHIARSFTHRTSIDEPESSKPVTKTQDSEQTATSGTTPISNPPESPLRQRLRNTLNKGGVKPADGS